MKKSIPEPGDLGADRLRYSAFSVKGRAGASFKHEHFTAISQDGFNGGFFEVHAENYMGPGGPPHRYLDRIRIDHPISLHGVCMSIGGPQPLDKVHLSRFKALVERYEPAMVSEHLAWSTHESTFYNDLLPLPYDSATLDLVCSHVAQMQDVIGRRILLENPATYVLFDGSTMAETDFIRAVAKRTGCGLLLDINNVFVSSTNHGYSSSDYLSSFPLELVGEIHLAGHAVQQDDEGDVLLIDSHDGPVIEDVWKLYESVLARTGAVATLVEWDSKIPEWHVLRGEAEAAQAILDRAVSARTEMGNAA
jgi:uncharacterized protein (UPF0276 family)